MICWQLVSAAEFLQAYSHAWLAHSFAIKIVKARHPLCEKAYIVLLNYSTLSQCLGQGVKDYLFRTSSMFSGPLKWMSMPSVSPRVRRLSKQTHQRDVSRPDRNTTLPDATEHQEGTDDPLLQRLRSVHREQMPMPRGVC